MQRVAQFQGGDKLTTSNTTGLVQPHVTTTDRLSGTAPTRVAPILPFANYLHSQHDPVSPIGDRRFGSGINKQMYVHLHINV